MYRSIYVPFDNSEHANLASVIAADIAKAGGAGLTAAHVYAAALHDRRFRQMESGLPEPYLKEDKLVEQREIHDDLIGRGLRIISESYLDVVSKRCAEAAIDCRRTSLEGKNWRRLVEDIGAAAPDLVVMGSLGLGAVGDSQIGTVCERVARRIDRDLLVIKATAPSSDGSIVAAIDGSRRSYGALSAALMLGRLLGRPVEAVAAFDPNFHYVAFNRIAGVLSPEAAQVFRFKEQEKLHEDIIDGGLAKIYQANLEIARRMASAEGIELKTTLLAGKPFAELLRFVRARQPWLLAVGRVGVHADDDLDLGGTAENLLRLAPCNILLAARSVDPPAEDIADITLTWTREAEARMERVPQFVRGMARQAVLRFALDRGHTVVTSDVLNDCLVGLMPSSPAKPGVCPFANTKDASNDGRTMHWDADAEVRLGVVPEGFMRRQAAQRIENVARAYAADRVTAAIADEGLAESRRMLAERFGEDLMAKLS
ncbi:MAG: universal stress protein UspA [Alphaproteobacteria bacterium]|nr:universal stress protein UspA [Alphaproteobacteria bacterium]